MATATLARKDRTLLAWGAALLLAGPAIAGGLGVAGGPLGLAELPRAPLIAPGTLEQRVLCTSGGAPPYCPGNFAGLVGPAGAAYVAPSNVFVVAIGGVNPSQFDEVSPTTLLTVRSVLVNCTALDLLYPGSGTTTYTLCPVGGIWYVAVYDTAIHALQVPLSTIRLPTGLACQSRLAIYGDRELYCVTTNGTLLGISIMGSIGYHQNPLASGPGLRGAPLWADNRTDRLFVGDAVNASVYQVDPGTGRIVATLHLPDGATSICGDVTHGRLFVSFGPSNGGNTSVYNLSTLAKLSTIPVYTVETPVVDLAHGEVYFDNYGTMAAIDSSQGTLVAGTGMQVGGNAIAYDPSLDTFLAPQGGGGVVGVFFLPVTHTTASPAPFSAVPGVGSTLTWYVAGVGVVLGATLLLLYGGRVRQRRRAEGERSLEELRSRPRERV
jgi:hypothetical protein